MKPIGLKGTLPSLKRAKKTNNDFKLGHKSIRAFETAFCGLIFIFKGVFES
jgi:hypothetical protein